MAGPVPFETGELTFGGHRLVFDQYGQGDRVLVYLHGLMMDSDMNRALATSLAQRGHRVVLLDLLGHGRSDKPGHAAEYRIDAYAEQTIALLDELSLAEAVLGGMSLGANVSLFAAHRHPERVRAMVLEMPVLEWAVPSAAMLFVPLLLMAHYGGAVTAPARALLRRVPRTPFGSINSMIHAAAQPPEVMAAVLHGVLVGPVCPTSDARAELAMPALVVAHDNDLIHPFDDASNLVKQLRDGRLVQAHSPFELRMRPERLLGEIDRFLAQVWADGGGATGSTARTGTEDA